MANTNLKSFDKDLYYMDTYINVKVYTNDSVLANKALKEVDSIFKEYHQLSDRYNHYDGITNISDFNTSPINQTITIDQKLYDLIKLGKDYNKVSKGYLNIALGNVIDIWKKYRDANTGVPTLQELKNSGSTNIDDLIMLDNNQIMKTSNISIDLGGVAKGYTTQVVGDYLKKVGLTKFIINAGGNVLVGDHYADAEYKIGLEKPDQSGDIYKVIKANNKAVVTSGGYERYYIYNEVKYHHIIDPYTYFPPNDKQAVSVICDNSATCDIYSTTLFLMPTKEIMTYIKDKPIDVIIYTNDNKIITSSGVKNYE